MSRIRTGEHCFFKDTMTHVVYRTGSRFPTLEKAVLRIRIRRIQLFLGLLDPDPLARDTDRQAKKSEKP